MTTALATIDFHGDKLQALEQDGAVYSAIRPMCDALGIDVSRQLSKLKTKAWATVVMMSTVGDDGKTREMACLDVDSIPMWLAGIESSRVAEHVRPKLLLFQLEARRALRDHFMPRPVEVSVNPSRSGPIQARIGDDIRARGCVFSMCRAAARVSGRTVQSIHGELRKPWGVASIYRIALSSYEHTTARLQEIIDGALNVRRLPAYKRQVELPFAKPN